MGFKNSRFKITATVGKKRKTLGTFSRVSSVDKILKKSKELKKTFPFSEKSTIRIQTIRNGKNVGKPLIKVV